MSVLVMTAAVVVLDIHDDSLTAGISVLVMTVALHVHRQYDTCHRGGSHSVAFHFPLVGPAEFFYSLGNAPETYHRRFPNVLIVKGLQYYYCSSRIQADDTDTCGLYCLYYIKGRHRGMDLPDIVKDLSIVDLKGNEDKMLRSDC
jgi:hypothetical protein